MQSGVEQEKALKPVKLIKYSSPTDVYDLSVIVEQNLTKNKNMFNDCTALKVINPTNEGQPTNQDNSLICFATFNRAKEEIDNEIIRNEIGKLLGINMPNICRISTADRKQNGLIIDTNLKSDTIPTIASQPFSDKSYMFMHMNKSQAQLMNDFIAYFPTEEDLKNPQTTFAMLLKGATSLPYKEISNQLEQKKFIEEYYDMIVLDLLTGQKKRNGQDYYYYTEVVNTSKGPVTKGHIIPGLLNYSFNTENKDADTYYLNDFPVDIDVLMDKLFTNSYMFIQRVVDSLISSLVDYKDCISRIIYNNTNIENAKKIEEMIFHNIDKFVAKAHGTKKIAERLSKIEKISTTTKMNLESVNRIIEFQHRYPTSKEEIIENNDKITILKRNENGDYEATIEEEGIKLTLNKDEDLPATGYTSSGLLSALIAFVCGLGFGLAYIISHLK